MSYIKPILLAGLLSFSHAGHTAANEFYSSGLDIDYGIYSDDLPLQAKLNNTLKRFLKLLNPNSEASFSIDIGYFLGTPDDTRQTDATDESDY